jgi:hypothetical protein
VMGGDNMQHDSGKETLEIKVHVLESAKEEREISDGRYAIKLVEVVVWGLVAIILSGVAVGIISLVVK